MKNRLIVFISFVVFIVFLCLVHVPSTIVATSLHPSIGKVRLTIFDSQNNPIEMATICVTDTSEYYTTGKLGECEISLPVKQQNRFSNQPIWTEYTLIISKNGYIPHILYGLKSTANITRTGIVITLVNLSAHESSTYTESYDFPTESYSTNLIKKHKK